MATSPLRVRPALRNYKWVVAAICASDHHSRGTKIDAYLHDPLILESRVPLAKCWILDYGLDCGDGVGDGYHAAQDPKDSPRTDRSPHYPGGRRFVSREETNKSGPGTVLSVSDRIGIVPWRRLQDGDHGTRESEPGRPVRLDATRAVMRRRVTRRTRRSITAR
jgi:hypothetical protein